MEGSTIQVLTAGEEDARDILGMQRRAFATLLDFYGVPTLPPMDETIEDFLRDLGRGVVLKAVEDGRLLGAVRGWRAGGSDVYVARLAVEPGESGRGVAKTLMRELESRFPGACRFELFTGRGTPAESMYAKLGYVPFRDQDEQGVHLVWMEKKVS